MSEWLQLIFALPLFLIGIGSFVLAMIRPGSIGMLRLSIFAFALQYCIGPIKAPFVHAGQFDIGAVVYTFATIYLFWLGAFGIGVFWRNRLDPVLIARDSGLSSERGVFACLTDAALKTNTVVVIVFYCMIVFIRVFVQAVYGFGLSGTHTLERLLAMPYWLLVIHQTLCNLGTAFIYLATVKIAYRQPSRIWYVLILALELVNSFTQGRRVIFCSALFILFAFLMKHGRVKVIHALVGAGVMAGLWYTVFPFFVNIRGQWEAYPDHTVSMWIDTAWQLTKTGGYSGEVERDYYASINTRLNALALNYEVADRLMSGYKTLHGEFLKQAAMNAVPRFMFPNKLEIVGGDDVLLNDAMDLNEGDLFSNFPCFAMADFGLVGGLIYGAIFGLAICSFEVMMRILFRRNSIGAFAIFSVAATTMVLQMEFPPGPFANAVRLVVLVFLMFYCWSVVFRSAAGNEDVYAYVADGTYESSYR